MQPVVTNLKSSEMLAISAYLASLPRASGANQSLQPDTSSANEPSGVERQR
jgi:cytochrome c553